MTGRILSLLVLLVALIFPFEVKAFNYTYGIGSHLSTRYNDEDKKRVVTKLQEVGAKWTRLEICYTTGTDFTGDTNAFNALAGTGVNVIALVQMCDGKKSVEDWGNFVKNAVTKFNRQAQAWEIINEPYGAGWSAVDYKDYLHRAHEKIKSVNRDAIVLASANPQFLYELYQVPGAKEAFDAVAMHPYKDEPPEEIQEGQEDFLGHLRQLVAVIKANGGGKRAWLTEFGRPSGSPRADQQQADYQVRAAMIARDLPEVEVITLYNIRDDGTGHYGVIRSDFSNKPAFERWQDLQTNIEGKAYSGQVLIADQQRIDDFTSFDGWDTNDQVATSKCEVRHDSGREGRGMKLEYVFTNDRVGSAYCAARKKIDIPGAPSTIGFWIDGDNSSNIWRMRIEDATGQIHQLLLGTFPSGWRYVRYDLVNHHARTHWGGADDGIIHYPIKFDSLVIDRNNNRGYHEGAAYLDDLFVLHGAGDYWGYRFGNVVAAWRTSFEGWATVCGQRKFLTERPQYLVVNPSDCPAMDSFR